MTFTEQLKEQLVDFVESYRKYFRKTFAVAMTFTVLCFVASAVLIWFDNFDADTRFSDLLHLLFYHYSYSSSYELVDLASVFSYFFIAVFSLLLFQYNAEDTPAIKEFVFGEFIDKISAEDVVVLIGTLGVACGIDFLLFKFYNLFSTASGGHYSGVYHFVSHTRQYLPLMLFAVTIHWLTNGRQLNVTWKELLYLFITLWIFNQLAFDFYLWIGDGFLDILLLNSATAGLVIFYQSLLCIPVMGSYFVGYYSALTWWLRTGEAETMVDDFTETPADDATETVTEEVQ